MPHVYISGKTFLTTYMPNIPHVYIFINHYNDVIISATTFYITSVSIVCSTICSSADQRKHQSSASLAFVRGIHWWPENVSSWWRHHVAWNMSQLTNTIFHTPTLLLFNVLTIFSNSPTWMSSTSERWTYISQNPTYKIHDTHSSPRPLDKIAVISQTIFWDAFL